MFSFPSMVNTVPAVDGSCSNLTQASNVKSVVTSNPVCAASVILRYCEDESSKSAAVELKAKGVLVVYSVAPLLLVRSLLLLVASVVINAISIL